MKKFWFRRPVVTLVIFFFIILLALSNLFQQQGSEEVDTHIFKETNPTTTTTTFRTTRTSMSIVGNYTQQQQQENPQDISSLIHVPRKINNTETTNHHHKGSSSSASTISSQTRSPLQRPLLTSQKVSSSSSPIKYIFGHSTGHAGSTASQLVIENDIDGSCPWNNQRFKSMFEKTPSMEWKWKWPPSYDDSVSSSSSLSCEKVKSHLIPFLENNRRGIIMNDDGSNNNFNNNNDDIVLIDMGHYHNRGRVMECLASLLGSQIAFIHIRRNRYDIASSFTGTIKRGEDGDHRRTSCYAAEKHLWGKEKRKPLHGLCPHSQEIGYPGMAGYVNLPILNDTIWESNFTPFQKFLWYTDEMEHRWYTLQRDYPQYTTYSSKNDNNDDGESSRSKSPHTRSSINRTNPTGPTYLEVTWSSSLEFEQGLHAVRTHLGCSPPPPSREQQESNKDTVTTTTIQNVKQHSRHVPNTKNCSDLIRQDMEYRRMMNYSKEIWSILYTDHQFPQHVDSSDCFDTTQDLVRAIRSSSASASGSGGENTWNHHGGYIDDESIQRYWRLPP